MQDALQIRQNNISNLNETYFQLSEESPKRNGSMPEHISEKVESLNDDWLKIQEYANDLRPLSDVSMEEDLLEGWCT